MTSEAMKLTGTILHYASKTIGALGAGHKMHERLSKQNTTSLDKLDLFTQGAFITLTGITAGLTEATHATSAEVGIGLHAAEGVADISRYVTDKAAEKNGWTSADALNLLGIFGIRTGEVTGFACEHYPHILNGHQQEVELVGSIIGTMGSATRNRKVIIQGSRVFLVAGNRLFKFIRKTDKDAKSEGDTKSDAASTTKGAIKSAGKNPLSEAEQKELSAFCMDIETFRASYLKDPKSCTVIPECLIDSNIWDFVCPISTRPIRFIRVPNVSEDTLKEYPYLAELCYEAGSLEKWIKDNPEKAPPGWPEGLIAPKISDFKEDVRCQTAINKKLENLARNYF